MGEIVASVELENTTDRGIASEGLCDESTIRRTTVKAWTPAWPSASGGRTRCLPVTGHRTGVDYAGIRDDGW